MLCIKVNINIRKGGKKKNNRLCVNIINADVFNQPSSKPNRKENLIFCNGIIYSNWFLFGQNEAVFICTS